MTSDPLWNLALYPVPNTYCCNGELGRCYELRESYRVLPDCLQDFERLLTLLKRQERFDDAFKEISEALENCVERSLYACWNTLERIKHAEPWYATCIDYIESVEVLGSSAQHLGVMHRQYFCVCSPNGGGNCVTCPITVDVSERLDTVSRYCSRCCILRTWALDYSCDTRDDDVHYEFHHHLGVNGNARNTGGHRHRYRPVGEPHLIHRSPVLISHFSLLSLSNSAFVPLSHMVYERLNSRNLSAPDPEQYFQNYCMNRNLSRAIGSNHRHMHNFEPWDSGVYRFEHDGYRVYSEKEQRDMQLYQQQEEQQEQQEQQEQEDEEDDYRQYNQRQQRDREAIENPWRVVAFHGRSFVLRNPHDDEDTSPHSEQLYFVTDTVVAPFLQMLQEKQLLL